MHAKSFYIFLLLIHPSAWETILRWCCTFGPITVFRSIDLIRLHKQWPRSRKVNITITRAPYCGCKNQCWGLKLVFYLIVFFSISGYSKNNLCIYSIYFNVNKRSANVKLKICHVTELATSVNEVHHNMKE